MAQQDAAMPENCGAPASDDVLGCTDAVSDETQRFVESVLSQGSPAPLVVHHQQAQDAR